MNYLSLALGWSIVWAGLSITEPARAQAVTSQALGVMDIDGSGGVDQAEHGIAMGAAFAHADKNADGVLDADEAALLSLPPQVDADGDGRITLQEYLDSARQDFEATDQDGDGLLVP
ncbi:EF-hand domain-containing protein [Geminicoccus flavidas]|uniref:hypothetical protein n=1 Tax=Geminicoccus flavidas TaxID=2506407 RepID=UPI0013590F03|nr:hypothetical protein [Geminicoccus flavidas]